MISISMKIFDEDQLVTIQVIYHMPDHVHVLNEFVWQTHDVTPKFPRTHKFIDYWHKNIDGPINEALVWYVNYWGAKEYRKVDYLMHIQ